MEAFGVLFLVGLVIAISIGNRRARAQLVATFTALGKQLGGGHDLAARCAWGEVADAKVWYRFTTRGSGKHTTHWTEVDVEIPPQYPLRLYVRKHGWLDQGKIDRGEMVDVIVGDAAFDNRFLVEAAPADVARILLDPRERAYLLELEERLWFDITTHRSDGGARLRLAIRSWIYDLGDAMKAIEAMAAIGGRLRAAYAAVERAAEPRDIGSPYRPLLDDQDAREAADARLAEVKRVDQIRTARTAHEQTLAVAVILAFVVVGIMVAIAGS